MGVYQIISFKGNVKSNAFLMRTFDVVVATILLLFFSPLLLLLAASVKSSSPGPVFYRAKRVGKDGKLFYLFKFRTMVTNAAKIGPGITVKGDSRITPIGHWLRRTKLDELPQLLNVLAGEMAFVGARPEDPRYVDYYTAEEAMLLTVRPGITSAASICYRNEQELLQGEEWETIYINQVMREKLAIDLAYLAQRSFVGDLNILLHTVLALFDYEPTVRQGEQTNVSLDTLLRQAQAPSRLGRFMAVRWQMALTDTLVVVISLWVSLLLRFEFSPPMLESYSLLLATPLIVSVYLMVNRQAGLYRYLWRYASAREIWRIGVAAFSGMVVLVLGDLLFFRSAGSAAEGRPIPLSVLLLSGVFVAGGMIVIRYQKRLLTAAMGYIQPVVGSPLRQRVLIIGAGLAATTLAHSLARQVMDYEIVGYIDDDPRKHGKWLVNAQVLGGREMIKKTVVERDVSLIIFAIQRITGADFRELLTICQHTKAQIRTIRMDNSTSKTKLLPIELADLFAFQLPVLSDEVTAFWEGKKVLVTGATGLLGRAVIHTLNRLNVGQLILLDTFEEGLGQLANGKAKIVLGHVCDAKRMESLLADYQPEIVIHTATYSQPALIERNISEAIRFNVGGTTTMVKAAAKTGVKHFVLASTDQASRCQTVWGMTMRLAEQALQLPRALLCSVLRCHDLFQQPGGFVPTLLTQIKQGGPVRITAGQSSHLMSVSQAAKLLIKLPLLGGGYFATDIGETWHQEELAHKLIQMSGLRPRDDIVIEVMQVNGKLPNQLEDATSTVYPFIKKLPDAEALCLPTESLFSLLEQIEQPLSNEEMKKLLENIMEEF